MDISPSQDGGVLKEILTHATGEETPMAGDKVRVAKLVCHPLDIRKKLDIWSTPD